MIQSLSGDFNSRSVLDNFQRNQVALQQSINRLSTGKTISRAADDPSGLDISTRYNAQMMGLEQGILNTQTSSQMLQTAEDGHNTITEILQNMRSLAVRASDASLNDSERSNVQQQVKDLYNEINRQAGKAVYNGKNLLDGTYSDSLSADPSKVSVLTNDTMLSGNTLVSMANGGPQVSGNVNSGTYKFVTVANSSGGVDVQVFSSQSRDPNQPITTIANVDQGPVTATLGPLESSFVKTGKAPVASAITPDGTRAVVVNSADSTVDIRNLTNPANGYQTIASIQLPAGSNPTAVAMDPNGRFAYVLNNGSGGGASSVSRINLATNTLYDSVSVGHNAQDIKVSGDGTKAYVSNHDDGTVSALDLTHFSQTGTIHVGQDPEGLAVSRDGSTVWVANEGSGSVSKIDVPTGQVTNVQIAGLSPRSVTLSNDGSKLFVGAKYTDAYPNVAHSIAVVDTGTNAVSSISNAGVDPEKIAVDPNGQYLYVSNVSAGQVTVLNASDYTRHSVMPGQFDPGQIQFFNSGNNGILTNSDTSRVVSNSNPAVADVLKADQAQFGVYDIKVVQAGTYSASKSSQSVTGYYGIDPSKSIASAGFASTPDTGGTIEIDNSNGKLNFTWSTTDTVQSVLDKINNNTIGVSASYNSANNILSINSPVGVTLKEITNNPGGNGFFSVNKIAASGTGVTYTGAAQSSSFVTRGLQTANTLGTAGYADPIGTSGTIRITNSNGAYKTFKWDATTTVDGLLSQINQPGNNLGITAQFDPTKNSLKIAKNPGLASFTLSEIVDGGGKGFFDVNHIAAGAQGTTYTADVASNPDVIPGINPNAPMNSAGFSQTFSKGVLMMNDGHKTIGVAYDPAVNSANDVVNAINVQFGAGTAAYDTSNNRLTITKPDFTLYDVPQNGGTGFFKANYITAATTGTSYVGAETSSAPVHGGVQLTNTLASAGYELGPTMDSGGVLMISNGSKTVGVAYDKNTSTVQNVLDGINNAFGAGTASYDASKNFLTINQPNFTLFDVTNAPGAQGFFATNKINVVTNEPAALTNPTSSARVAPLPPPVQTGNPVSSAGFFLAPDTQASFTINSRNTQTGAVNSHTFNYNANTTTVDSLLNQINTAGLGITAAYDPLKTQLTLTPGANTDFSYNEITNNAANNGFLNLNFMPNEMQPAIAAASTSDVASALDLSAPLSQAGYFEPVTSTAGTISIHDQTTNTTSTVSYNSNTLLGDIMTQLKTSTPGLADAQYVPTNNGLKLQLTFSGNDVYNLSESKSSANAVGFLDANDLPQGVALQGVVSSATAVAPNGNGVDTSQAMRTAGFFDRIGESGSVTFDTRNMTTGAIQSQTFNWTQNMHVQDFLNQVNSAGLGITMGYDATGQRLQVNTDGNHTFTYSEIAKMSPNAPTPPALNTAATLNNAGFFLTPDSQGSFTLTTRNTANNQIQQHTFNYNAATDTAGSVVSAINAAGLGVTAAYDPSKTKLSLTPNAGFEFTYNEITNGPNNAGFLGVNFAPGLMSQQTNATSKTDVSATLDFSATLNQAGFFNPVTSTAGTITLHDNVGNTNQTINYNQNTTLGDLIIGIRNLTGVQDAFYVADPAGLKLEVDFSNNHNFRWSETKSSPGSVGFLDANRIPQNTNVSNFTLSAGDIAPAGNGVDTSKGIAVSGYFKHIDTSGELTFSTRNTLTGQLQTQTFNWTQNTVVQNLLNQISSSGLGISAVFDATHQHLSILGDANHTFTMSEMTANGGNGFLDVNNIQGSSHHTTAVQSEAAATTGTQVLSETGLGFMAVNHIIDQPLNTTAITSTTNVTTGRPRGIDRNAPVGNAFYTTTPDTSGTIALRNNGQTYTFNWNAASTTTNNFLSFLQKAGLNPSYDANNEFLTVNGNFQAWEVTAHGGPGLFAINNISIPPATGSSFNGRATSSAAVVPGIDTSQSMAANPFSIQSDSGGQLTVKNSTGAVSTMRWDRTTTKVQDILNFLTGAGINATYDPHGDKLTLNGGGSYTLYEATDHGGPGFFAVNNILDSTAGTHYTGSVTSTFAITTPPGINEQGPIGSNHYALTPDTGGVIKLTNDQGVEKEYHWTSSENVHTLLDAINADSSTTGISVGYSPDGAKLRVTKAAGINSFSLAEITNNGGAGFFAVNNIDATATGTTYAASTESTTPVTAGINQSGKIDGSNNFAITPGSGGNIDIKTDLGEKTFQWNNNTVVGDLLNQINGAGLGIQVGYDPSGHTLQVTPGNGVTSYTLSELTSDGGPGFFAVNKINASPTGTTYTGNARSSQPVTARTDIDEANRPLTSYSYLDNTGNVQKVNAGNVSINGQNVAIGSTDTLDDVVRKINALTGSPTDTTGTHVAAFFQEDAAHPGNAFLTLKSTAYGDAITLGDPDHTNFWSAMHVTDDASGKSLIISTNGTQKTEKTADVLNGAIPGAEVLFKTRPGGAPTSPSFFTDANAGVYSGPLNTSDIIRIDRAPNQNSGLSFLNNGALTVTFNQATPQDVGRTAYVRTTEAKAPVTTDNSLQVHWGADEAQTLSVGIADLRTQALFGVGYTPNVSTQIGAEDLIGAIDVALQRVGQSNTKVGDRLNEIQRTQGLAQSHLLTITQANSLLTDTNFPSQVTALTRAELISQSSTAMLSQANLDASRVLNLVNSSTGK